MSISGCPKNSNLMNRQYKKKSFKEIYFCNNNPKKNEQYEFKKSFYVIEFFFRVLKNDCNKILHYTR